MFNVQEKLNGPGRTSVSGPGLKTSDFWPHKGIRARSSDIKRLTKDFLRARTPSAKKPVNKLNPLINFYFISAAPAPIILHDIHIRP